MKGSGILLLEDDSVYEGNFTEDLTFVGKVSVYFISPYPYGCLLSKRPINSSKSHTPSLQKITFSCYSLPPLVIFFIHRREAAAKRFQEAGG